MGRAPRKRSTPQEKPPPKIELGPFQKAVNESAARLRGLWLGYIALLAYLAIALAAVTHLDLLLKSPVKLPVLNVDLPLIGFFIVAPLFFLTNHFYLLLQLAGLGWRIREFNEAIAKTGQCEAAQRRERRKLDTFVIVQMLGGTKEERKGLMSWFLRTIALITLVLAPITLLLFIQLKFLPYQKASVTWLHRAALGLDLALLCFFWPSIRLGEWAPSRRILAWALPAFAIMLFACGIATFPGELVDGRSEYPSKNSKCEDVTVSEWRKPEDSYLYPWRGPFFGDLKLENKNLGFRLFSRALDLSDHKTLIDLDEFDKIRRRYRDSKDQYWPWQAGWTLDLRGRNLRGARFDHPDLRNVDLFGAKLQAASLENANLRGASLDHASLQGASLRGANLQGARLKCAQLQHASLDKARLLVASLEEAGLQGASLYDASLQGASLKSASLQGASLIDARLQGASLDRANLKGALLFRASLQGASLKGGELQGVLLEQAKLQGASLDDANLKGASLDGASLQGASLDGVSLQGASLVSTYLWRAEGTPDPEYLSGLRVREPRLQALMLEERDRLEQRALRRAEGGSVKQRIRKALARLAVPELELRNRLPDDYWIKLTGKTSELEHQRDLAKLLVALACEKEDAPYVAQAFIKEPPLSYVPVRLEATGPHLPSVAKKLLDAVKGRTTDCPGVKGLDTDSIGRLREWAARTPEETQMERTAQ